jgi:CheY-like chemotaxis protein
MHLNYAQNAGLEPCSSGDAGAMGNLTSNGGKSDKHSGDQDSPLILVVDDNTMDRRIAGGILTKQLAARILYAQHGVAALEIVEKSQPDLVLTDLQMPEMDGLALVEAIRRKYPLVPTILMTAHGSEETAIQALKRGAANYVPKRNLARSLAETVKDVLAMARVGRQQLRLYDFWSKTEFQFSLENDAALIPLLVSHLQHYLTLVQQCDQNELVRVGVALHEALRNAIHHGNLELQSDLRHENPEHYYQLAEQRRLQQPYSQRRVYVTATESPSEARYVIRDEGPGFDPSATFHDPTDDDNLELPSGRGILLMRTFMHDVRYSDRGNEITLVYRRNEAENGSERTVETANSPRKDA